MTPAQQRTRSILERIDRTLAEVSNPQKSRSLWTTREIENLLLDIRNEVQHFADFERFEEQVKEMAREQRKGWRRRDA